MIFVAAAKSIVVSCVCVWGGGGYACVFTSYKNKMKERVEEGKGKGGSNEGREGRDKRGKQRCTKYEVIPVAQCAGS